MSAYRKLGIMTCLGLSLMPLSSARAEDHVRWALNFQQAAATARTEHKLVLLHFYSDDCPPCVRVDRNVFSQAAVADAIGRNYVPIKVHVKNSPQLASRYQVRSWPTDIIVTPAGQEVFRTTSPQSPLDYVALVDRIALQAGVGAGRTAQAQTLLRLDSQEAQAVSAQVPEQAVPPPGLRSSYQPQHFADSSHAQPPTAQQSAPVESAYSAPTVQSQPAPATQQMLLNRYASDPSPSTNFGPAPAQVTLPAVASTPPAMQSPLAQRPTMQPPAAQQHVMPSHVAASEPAGGSQSPVRQMIPASEAPPIAMEGFCPVTILEKTTWQKGDPQFGAIHRGRTYLFASPAEQGKFLADPDRYSPALSGHDAVRFAASGELVEGKRSFGVTFRNQLFMFADAAGRDRFEQNPGEFTTAVHQAMLRSETQTKFR